MKLIFRPATPPCWFTMLKNAVSIWPIGL